MGGFKSPLAHRYVNTPRLHDRGGIFLLKPAGGAILRVRWEVHSGRSTRLECGLAEAGHSTSNRLEGGTRVASSKMRHLSIQFGAAVLALGLAGCTGTPGPPALSTSTSNSPPAVEPSATFNFGTASMPLGLDPAVTADSESYRVTRQVLEARGGVDGETGQTTPLLATEWKDSNNG